MRPAKIFGKPTAARKFGGLSDRFPQIFGEFKLKTNKESYRTDQTVLAYIDVPFDGPKTILEYRIIGDFHNIFFNILAR